MRWSPLEANSEIFQLYSNDLGVKPGSGLLWCDIFSIEDDLISTNGLPPTVHALVLLTPNCISRSVMETQEHKGDAYFVKQHIANACGPIALIHSLMNVPGIEFEEGSFFAEAQKVTSAMDPLERAEWLERSYEMINKQENFANLGQSKTIPAEETVQEHFVTFIQREGGLYELDGTRPGPYKHCDCDMTDFVSKAVAVIKDTYISKAEGPDSLRFCLMALAQ